jgi:spermidine/putrescine transport system substrate-binding protein
MMRTGEVGQVISFANWPEYIDRDPADPAQPPTLAEFTRRSGIPVSYSEPITDNEQFFARIGVPLARRESIGYDLIVLSDWTVAQVGGMGWARPFRPDVVPNAANLLPAIRESPLASVLDYSLPWQAGLTGIGYNLAATGRPVTSMTDLLTAPDLRGRVALVSEMRDVMGLLLLDRGHDPAAFTSAEFDLTLESLESSVRSGQIRTVTNRYRAGLARGDIAACVGWSGDVLSLGRADPRIQFAIPPSGALLWTENLMIPAYADNPEGAERLIDYYYQPDVAARLAVSQLFTCPVEGASEVLPEDAPGLSDHERRYVFPPPEVLSACHVFRNLTPVESSVLTDKYVSAVGL